MKKNYHVKEAVSNEWIADVIQLSQGEVYCIQGGLNDAYAIDFHNLHYGRVRRNWLIVVPEFANEWGNELHAMLTDDETIVEHFIHEYEKQQDDLEYYPVLEGVFMKSLKQIREEELNNLISKLG